MLLSRDSTPLSHGNDESLFQDAKCVGPTKYGKEYAWKASIRPVVSPLIRESVNCRKS